MVPTWRIRPISFGELEVDQGALTAFHDVGHLVRIPCLAWLVSNETGDVVVVDAGPPEPDVVYKRKGRVLYREAKHDPGRALRAAGVDPTQVRSLVITHLHWDHIGNLGLFPNARFFVQRAELRYAVAPLPLHAAAYESLDGRNVPLWVEHLPRMAVLDGEHTLLPGISLHPLPGHTPGLQGVRVVTSEGAYVIASDAIPTYANWELGIPSATYTDLASYEESFATLRRIADHVLPSHDMRVLETGEYPQRSATV